jgi:hypothetical protein
LEKEWLAGPPGWLVNHPGLARIGGGGDQQVHLSSEIGQQLGQVAGVTNSNLGQDGPIGREGVVEGGRASCAQRRKHQDRRGRCAWCRGLLL